MGGRGGEDEEMVFHLKLNWLIKRSKLKETNGTDANDCKVLSLVWTQLGKNAPRKVRILKEISCEAPC
jgi:hypothetical protein